MEEDNKLYHKCGSGPYTLEQGKYVSGAGFPSESYQGSAPEQAVYNPIVHPYLPMVARAYFMHM